MSSSELSSSICALCALIADQMGFYCWLSIAAFLWARELVFTIFTSMKTVPKHSRELEIS